MDSLCIKTVSNDEMQTQNTPSTVVLPTKNALQRVTQTSDPFCLPTETIRKKAYPLSSVGKSPTVAAAGGVDEGESAAMDTLTNGSRCSPCLKPLRGRAGRRDTDAGGVLQKGRRLAAGGRLLRTGRRQQGKEQGASGRAGGPARGRAESSCRGRGAVGEVLAAGLPRWWLAGGGWRVNAGGRPRDARASASASRPAWWSSGGG